MDPTVLQITIRMDQSKIRTPSGRLFVYLENLPELGSSSAHSLHHSKLFFEFSLPLLAPTFKIFNLFLVCAFSF